MNFRFSIFDSRLASDLPEAPKARVRSPSKIENRKSEIPTLPQRASVLVIVMVTLIFTALALTVFLEKASNDLIVEAREADTRRLRQEAYSALETTLAVLEQFRAASNGLHSSAEGWADPLGFAAYAPGDGRTVEVAFEDESGKLSLPRATGVQLQNLFIAWGLTTADSEKLADAILGWKQRNHTYATALSPAYEQSVVPYAEPRTVFFDETGRATDLYRRFVENVSLLSFRESNLNGARPDVLTAVGEFDETQKRRLDEYRTGTGTSASTGPGWFTAGNDAKKFLGAAGRANAFATTISALRIRVTVREGRSEYRLNVVVSPQGGGATSIITTATAARANTPENDAESTSNVTTTAQPSSRPTGAATAAAPRINYPFTILQLVENEPLPPPPPPPPS
jgi:general secretion pathway protein K